MIQSAKRTLSVLLVLVMVLSALAGALPQQAHAATGTLQHNTATRHETCTSLSDQALDYYTGQYSWDILSTTAGGTTNCADTDDNQLYQVLHTLMSSTHTKTVSYNSSNGLQKYWPYTDSSSAVPNTYVFFYSDVAGDGTMNREHVWPKSHGTFYESGAGSDLHHLRPTNGNVNSTRGNYTMGNVRDVISVYQTYTYGGKNVLYYSPTDYLVEINDNIKGDVARIFLYVWCRWEQPNLFQNTGSTGSGNNKSDGIKVIESLDTLLQWMELDPVDEWEMSRNDQVENVQGNRNVFIDYPELAWQIFGKEVPENLCAPSGGGSSTCTHEQTTRHAAVAPTCTADGSVEYWQCNSCRQYFSDAACTNRIYSIKVSSTGHNFKDGVCTGCGLEQSSAAAGSYVKVTSALSDWSGTYLIGYESGSEAKILTDNGSINKANNYSTLSVTGGQITSGITNEMIVTISKTASGTYLLQINGKYFGNNQSSSNALDTSSSATKYFSNITWDSGSAKIVSTTGGSVLRWNDTGNCFKFYKSTTYTIQKPIVLYKLAGESSTPPIPPTPVETVTAELVTKPQDGSTVYLFNPDSSSTVTAESYTHNSSKKELVLTSGTVSGTKLTTPTTACLFTVHVDSNGYYTFQTADGKYLSADGTNVELVSSASQYTIFQLETATDGWYIHSVNAEYNSQKNQYLEIYGGYLSVYGLNTSDTGKYIFRFYTVGETGCDHNWSKATCKTPSTCTKCGATTGSVDPSNHTGKPGAWQHDSSKHWKEYSCCGAHEEEASHSGGTATCTKQAICETCGNAYGELANHTGELKWKDMGDSGHIQYYTDCGCTVGEVKAHNKNGANGICTSCGHGCRHTGGIATCTKQAICEKCGNAYGEPDKANHTGKTELKNKKDASCTADGYTGDTCCSDCGEKLSAGQKIPATGHSAQKVEQVPASCTQTGCIAHWHCNSCGGDFLDGDCTKPATDLTIPITHDWRDATCCAPKTCKNCGATEGKKNSSNHEQEAQWTNVDDTTHRLYYSCCGKWTGKSKSHDWAKDSEGHTFCPTCGAGCMHSSTELKDAKDATCTEEGYTGDRYCTDCGRLVEVGSVIAPLAHSDDSPKDHKCDICGADVGEHKAAEGSHNCGYCGQPVTECADENRDHKCDVCGTDVGEHKAADGSHNCDYCGQPVTECTDDNKDHNCDVCGKKLTECADEDGDGKCDICSGDVATVAGKDNSGSSIILWVVLGLVALGLIVFVILLLLKKKKKAQQAG